MSDPFDAQLYMSYLRSRWRLPAAILAVALFTSATLSLLQSRKFTATVSLLIEPPASSDPRAAMAVSPIYLESLKTYEYFASSDHLFAQAVDKFGLRKEKWGQRPLESLKRAILRVAIPRNTKVLEISVTLPDAPKAHALASYIAERTVELSRSTGRSADDEFAGSARTTAEEALKRFHAVQSALEAAMKRAPTREVLEAELVQLRERRAEIQRLALSASLALADMQNRKDEELLRERFRSTKAHWERLRQEGETLATEAARKEQLLAQREAEIELLSAEYKNAQRVREQAEKRFREIQDTAGYRSERISLLDPGVVPERPSSPNLPLNLLVATALALIVSLIYLTAAFSLRSRHLDLPLKFSRVFDKP
jgi:uncharacterized protein involved in exopolysaccharide biosynthesis